MTIVSSRDVQEIVEKLSSDKAKAREVTFTFLFTNSLFSFLWSIAAIIPYTESLVGDFGWNKTFVFLLMLCMLRSIWCWNFLLCSICVQWSRKLLLHDYLCFDLDKEIVQRLVALILIRVII